MKAKTFPEKLRRIFRKLSRYLEQMLMEKRKQTWGGSSIHPAQCACDMTPPLLSSSTRAVGGNLNIWCFKETHHRCLALPKWKPILKYSLVISSNQGRRCNMQHWLTINNCEEQQTLELLDGSLSPHPGLFPPQPFRMGENRTFWKLIN